MRPIHVPKSVPSFGGFLSSGKQVVNIVRLSPCGFALYLMEGVVACKGVISSLTFALLKLVYEYIPFDPLFR